jgi:alpha-beta hydrolase superfamily lysophospholipase
MPVPAYPAPREAKREDGFIHSKDNLRLYWQRYTPPSPRATVAVIPGGGDHSGRYPALTAALVGAGFQAALLDFRGHGQSDGRRWHVDTFRDYLDDMDAFMGHVRAGAGGRRVMVVAHSQGALIAATWALGVDRGVSAFALSSPFFRLKLEPPRLKVLGARLVGTFVPWLPISTDLRYEDLTSDEDMQRWTRADPLYGRATTPRWFTESQRAQKEILRAARSFTHPLLVLVGGADPIADAEAGRAFYEAASSKDKAFQRYEGLRHEIFNERGRDGPIADAIAWLSARSP